MPESRRRPAGGNTFDGLPPLRSVVTACGLWAKKSLGQNFIFDLNLTRRIARAAGPLGNAAIVEIGPGPGGLTRALLAEGARKVIAIERDARCIPALAAIAAHYPGRLQIVEGDALETDFAALAGDERPARIVASPNESSAYGRLSVLANWRCETRILFDVPAAAFTPPPKVKSSLVELVPRAAPLACEVKLLSQVTQAAFGQRRKMLRQALKTLAGEEAPRLLALAGIGPSVRAEDVDVEGFAALARALAFVRNASSRRSP